MDAKQCSLEPIFMASIQAIYFFVEEITDSSPQHFHYHQQRVLS
jgi:hypothetical protein